MLDIVAAIFATAYCAAQAGLMIGPVPLRAGSKIASLQQRRRGSLLSLLPTGLASSRRGHSDRFRSTSCRSPFCLRSCLEPGS
jgi:hypothetical protein